MMIVGERLSKQFMCEVVLKSSAVRLMLSKTKALIYLGYCCAKKTSEVFSNYIRESFVTILYRRNDVSDS